MGTSTKLQGPTGGMWASAKAGLTRSMNHLATQVGESEPRVLSIGFTQEQIERHGQAFLDALSDELRSDTDAFGLLAVSQAAGERLVDVLEALYESGIAALDPNADTGVDEGANGVVVRFCSAVCPDIGLITDHVARKAAEQAIRKLIADSADMKEATTTGEGGAGWPVELFCEIYRQFFADIVREFMHAVIAAKVSLALPVLPAVDPSGCIAGWIARRVFELVPSPCYQEARKGPRDSVFDAGRRLAVNALYEALGLTGEDEDGAARLQIPVQLAAGEKAQRRLDVVE